MYYILCFSILFGARIQFVASEIVHTHLEDALLPHHHTASVSPDIAHFSLVQPSYLHSRTKRQISSTKLDKDSTEHINYLTVKYSINNTLYTLDLILNRDLLSASYFEKHQLNGVHVIRNRTNTKDIELCHYKGKLRGVPESWAALSTCDNILRGVIFDGTEMNYIEPLYNGTLSNATSGSFPHIVYKQSDYLAHDKHKCGFKSAHEKTRTRRDTLSRHDTVRGPYNANPRSRYLELVLVVDNRLYNLLNKDSRHVYRHCKDIVNVINALYEKLNIFVALVGVVVWTEYDEIAFNVNGDITLTNFLNYRRERLVKDHPNDNAQLLTGMTFQEGVVGKALKGPICTYEFSGGVNVDHANGVGHVATTVAHEMGHNLGMEHDTAECKCPGDRCIMSPSSSSVSPTDWSSCSMEYLAFSFDHGMDYCMRNKPKALFDGPVCGNGFVEDGEECDCGLVDGCRNACCNAATCTLHVNATCATGSCCNLETCQPHSAGRECRGADRECDLPEFCTGDSEFCPEDVFKLDGELCKGGEAFCYEGSCRTHSDQCRLLWGPSGASSDKQCYALNTSGNRRGNCGYNKMNQTFSKCGDNDTLCGMLHCQHLSEKLEFGIETVALLSHSFINVGGSITPCRSAIVDMGLNQVDPGLSPDGARCGEDMLCVNRKCMSVAALRASMPIQACPFNCHDQGVCNSRGHCHCNPGFAPPYCEYPGVGGSSDSGPASDPNASRLLITLFYTLSVAVLPLSALILFLKYYNNHPKSFWWKRPGVSRQVTHPAHSNPAAGVPKSPPHRWGVEPSYSNSAVVVAGTSPSSSSCSVPCKAPNLSCRPSVDPSRSVPCKKPIKSCSSVSSNDHPVSVESSKSPGTNAWRSFTSWSPSNFFSRMSAFWVSTVSQGKATEAPGVSKRKFNVKQKESNGKIVISEPMNGVLSGKGNVKNKLDILEPVTNHLANKDVGYSHSNVLNTGVSNVSSEALSIEVIPSGTSREVSCGNNQKEKWFSSSYQVGALCSRFDSSVKTNKTPSTVLLNNIVSGENKENKNGNLELPQTSPGHIDHNKHVRISIHEDSANMPDYSVVNKLKHIEKKVDDEKFATSSTPVQVLLGTKNEKNISSENEFKEREEPMYESIDIDTEDSMAPAGVEYEVIAEPVYASMDSSEAYYSDSFDSDEDSVNDIHEKEIAPDDTSSKETSKKNEQGMKSEMLNGLVDRLSNLNRKRIKESSNSCDANPSHVSRKAPPVPDSTIERDHATSRDVKAPVNQNTIVSSSKVADGSGKASESAVSRKAPLPKVNRESLAHSIVKTDLVSTTNNRVNNYLKSGVWRENK